jgi:hypothetical protein
MSLSDMVKGRNIVLGLAALAATGPAMNASEAAFSRFFYGNKIEYIASAEAGEAEASTGKWQYAKMGGKIPTEEVLLAEGYKCLNCDNPAVNTTMITNPDEYITQIKRFISGDGKTGLALYFAQRVRDSKVSKPYGFQELKLVDEKTGDKIKGPKPSAYCIATSPDIINQVYFSAGDFKTDVRNFF